MPFLQAARTSRFFAALSLFLASQLMAQTPSPDTEIPIKIVHMGPVSNRAIGFLGTEGENAAIIAAEDLNARQIQIGGKRAVFSIEKMDDAGDPEVTIAAAKRACQSGAAGVIGHLNSGPSIKAAPIYNQCGLPHITPSATNPLLTELGYNTALRVIGNDAAMGQLMAKIATSELQVKRVAIIHDRSAYGETISSHFARMARNLGAEVVLEDSLLEANPALTATVDRIKTATPELVFFGGMDGLAGKLLKEMSYQKVNPVKFMGGDGICSTELPKVAGSAEAVNQVICGEAGSPFDKMPGGEALASRYLSRYGKPVRGYAAQTYDAVFAIALAMQSANSADPKVYLPFLKKTSFEGVTGKIAFDAKGDLTNPVFSFYVYRNGKRELKS